MDLRIEVIIRILRQNIRGHLSMRLLAKRVNLSASHLRQLFKVETGISPMQFLRNLRMERSCALLLSSFLSIKEVSFESGFPDVSHFERDFKRCYGMTPSEFRSRSDKNPVALSAKISSDSPTNRCFR